MLDPTIVKPSYRVRQRLQHKLVKKTIKQLEESMRRTSETSSQHYPFISGVQQNYSTPNQLQQNAAYEEWLNQSLRNQEQFRSRQPEIPKPEKPEVKYCPPNTEGTYWDSLIGGLVFLIAVSTMLWVLFR
jgi:hypothetical protein